MIVQEINLYQDRFKEKTIWLSFNHMLIVTGLLLAFLVISGYWYNSQLRMAEQKNRALTDSRERSTKLLAAEQEKLQSLLSNNQIDTQISKVSSAIAQHKRINDFVSKNQFGSGQGFSSDLIGLAEINIKNVWLNEISLAGDYIKLAGSALKAEVIPEYFNQFRQSELFEGQVFEVFQLDRKPAQNWKVDFLIASQALDDE